eukprot:Colp12_sorted_trinity150504_noHs@2126
MSSEVGMQDANPAVVEEKVTVQDVEDKDVEKVENVEKNAVTVSPAEMKMAQGRRHLACNETASAVEAFQEALKLLVEQHGELGFETADAYMMYGNALLALSKENGGIFGSQLENEQQQEEEDESDSEDKENEGEQGTSEEPAEPAAPTPQEDDADGLQIAYESLECARVILEKATDLKSKAKLSEVYYMLGEFSMETENFNQAEDDFKSWAKTREMVYGPTNRMVIEAFYTMGCMLHMLERYDSAVTALKTAGDKLRLRIDELEANSGGKGKGKAATHNQDAEPTDEREQLLSILPELDQKVAEVIEERKAVKARTASTMLQSSGVESSGFGAPVFGATTSAAATGNGFSAPTTTQANDLTQMVRKKQKTTHEPATTPATKPVVAPVQVRAQPQPLAECKDNKMRNETV